MGITIRQHIATLVAVFLALLIGVLIGAALSQQPGLEKAIDELTANWSEERERNDALDLQLKGCRRFEQALLPQFVGERLTGRRILLVMTAVPEDGNLRDSIRAGLQDAGAVVPVTVTFREDYLQACEKHGAQALRDIGRAAAADDPPEHMAEEIAAAAVEAALAGERESLRALRKLVKVDGTAEEPFDSAVIAGGSDSAETRRDDLVDRPVARALLARELTVVGCESVLTQESYIRSYKHYGLSTVDHADTVPGQISLVWLLEGHDGHFGAKSTADRIFPDLEGP